MPHIDLLELPYFSGISLDAVVSLVELLEPAKFAAGEAVMTEGEGPPPPLYIATSGHLAVTKRGENGQDKTLAELHAPTLFGEIELFCQIPAVATVRAMTPVACFKLTRETFDRLFVAMHPAILGVTCNVARVACHRLAVADTMLTQMLSAEDLVTMRRTVFSEMQHEDWSQITGAFKRPQLKF